MIPASYMFKNAFEDAWVNNDIMPASPVTSREKGRGMLHPLLQTLQHLLNTKRHDNHSGAHAYK